MPTRLLDWTNNALAALFIAARELPEKDGSVFLMDAYQLATTQCPDSNVYKGIVTMRHRWFRDAMSRISDWNDSKKFPEIVMAVRPEHGDRRMGLQRSCFTFHVPNRPRLTLEENRSLLCFRIPSEAKEDIKKDLLLLGVDEFSIYGDLENLAHRLKRAQKIFEHGR
jgi:hypothetical protein